MDEQPRSLLPTHGDVLSCDGPMTALSSQPRTIDGSPAHAVLLVHGLGGGPYEVQRLAEHLATGGPTTQTILLPGHGLPRWRMPPSRWTEWYAAVKAAAEALSRRFARVDLVGFSTGAPLVLHLAAERALGEGRLVLLAPFLRVFRPRLLPVPVERVLEALPFVTSVPRREPPLRDAALRQAVARCAGYRTFSTIAARSAVELITEVEAELPSIIAPALVVRGLRDSVVDREGAEILGARLAGFRRLVDVDSDHLVTLDEAAPIVLEEVRRFLLTATVSD